MGVVGPMPYEGFLVGETCACVLVDGAGSNLKSSALSSHVFGGVYGFSTALGSLSTHVQGCVPVFPKDWHVASGTGACCLLDGAWS